MTDSKIPAESLVLYKTRPAVVASSSQKLGLRLPGGESINVRPKDVTLLHPGPAALNQLKPREGEMKAAWELLAGAGETTNLEELAELAYDEFSPATAWATWEWVADGLYFSGLPDAISVHSPEQVDRETANRAVKAAEAEAWNEFLARAQAGTTITEDARYLNEVEEVALGQRETSRVMQELGLAQTREAAHAYLLESGRWEYTVNPYPRRFNVALVDPDAALPALAEEERLDLTHLPAFAIDDEGSKDPDDALSIDGDRIWVHVADVAALVTPDSAADLEARARGANLYMPERTIPMLPCAATAALGLGLQEISPALSFSMRVDEEGRLHDIQVVPSLVRVQRLSYEVADHLLEDPPLSALRAATERFALRRQRGGAINLDLPEVKMRVVNGRVEIKPLSRQGSRSMVTEAMLMAGNAVAELAQQHEIPIPFTGQDPPDPLETTDSLSGMFARRKTMRPGRQSLAPAPHSGLGLEAYVRATSPLRRYLDLVAHQQLRAWLAGGQPLDEQAILERIGATDAVVGSVRQAESFSRRHWTVVYFMQNEPWRGSGIVVEANGPRTTVVVPELAWETRVHMRDEPALDSEVRLRVTGVNLPLLDAYFQPG